jgi:ABC-type uncharacterized transport system substrate-binding protein
MRRRDFIVLLGAAIASQRTSRAQQAMRRIAVLTTFADSDVVAQAWHAAFRKGLDEAGWHDGGNVQIETRWAAGDPDRLRAFAHELVQLKPDVIFAVTTPAVATLLQETHTLPIVFAQVSDPVGSGFVASVARPGGNVTGFTNIDIESSISGKWLDLVRQIAPGVRRVAMIYNPPTAPFADYYLRTLEAAGRAYGIQASAAAVHSDTDIENAISALAREAGGGLLVLPDTFTGVHRERIVSLAASYRLPAVYPFRWFAEIGGLLSYGIDSDDMFRRAAAYVDRVLKGTEPADLPVQAPIKYELVVNLRTAKALGLTVPETVMLGADQVIE